MRTGNLKTVLASSVGALALLGVTAPAEAEVNIGGYIKADIFYDLDQDLGDTFAASAIVPSTSNTEDGTLSMHAKQSRFWIKTSTKTEAGTLKTHIEGDFFDFTGHMNEVVSNSSHFRARHLYGQLGGLLVGQTWTNFMSLHSYADTVDFFGPTGMLFIRQVQVRYTVNPNDNLMVAVAIENPEVSGFETTAFGAFTSETGMGKDTLPDFTGRVKYSNDLWTGVLAGLVRPGMEIDEFDADAGTAAGESETGWGLHGSFGLSVGEHYLFANASYGEGIGRYMINGPGRDLFVDAVTGTVTAPAMLDYGIGGDFGLSDQLRTVWVYGHHENSDNLGAGDIDTLDTFHANVWYTPAENVRYGFEVMYGTVGFVGGADGDATRIQFGAQYSF